MVNNKLKTCFHLSAERHDFKIASRVLTKSFDMQYVYSL